MKHPVMHNRTHAHTHACTHTESKDNLKSLDTGPRQHKVKNSDIRHFKDIFARDV